MVLELKSVTMAVVPSGWMTISPLPTLGISSTTLSVAVSITDIVPVRPFVR